ncbi:FAS1-like dehydratase domain-containing protein [Wenxinia marina]|uniref:FAS1-like dehydratase domain-containing protein n=1 Tax=Wenxinia marina DSM 24838 TaxID=1123501 RepID=A0A0D0NI98_9RHOB|nr:MaoC family dehydratase N-terminal domain-containing protein [Wenxinia marina]KIQ68050.1 hypothetical protein Wenmar_03506 [Wenxinia marina DSM 24838]GGL75105.1 acyl-CoA dehydrogenase [Wenxinia marina]
MPDAAPATQTLVDPLDPARARALQATLGLTPSIEAGDPLPPFFHHIYFWEPLLPADLGRDGHPAKGGFIPDLGLPRRMWAAGELTFHTPLRAGSRAEKTSSVEQVTRKDGRSGPLAFVRVRHDIRQRGAICLTEWQELVYRQDPGPDAPKPEAPKAKTDEDLCITRRFDTTALFRYSALTFNGHRIHYDQPYAREVEGYDGLVVHGPLLAQSLMLVAEARMGRLAGFRYRATSPLMHHEAASCCWTKGGTLWVRAPDGRQNMIAEAR